MMKNLRRSFKSPVMLLRLPLKSLSYRYLVARKVEMADAHSANYKELTDAEECQQ